MKNTISKAAGIFIIAVSVVAALLFAAHNPPFWLPFSLSAGLLIGGLFILRRTVSKELQQSTAKSGGEITPGKTLGEAAEKIQKLITVMETGDSDDYLNRLNAIRLEYYIPFAENGALLIEKYGMKTYADLIIPFALSERLLNRSISALIDKYPRESLQALKDCHGHLQDVIQIENNNFRQNDKE